MGNAHPSRYVEATADGRFRCSLCPRACVLREGQRGFCFVRQATARGIDLTSYGQASGFCVDPIEKKPLFHFFPGSEVLSFGSIGCNLGCSYCQNWDLSRSTSPSRMAQTASPSQVALAARQAQCRSVAFTYNEPSIFAEYAIDAAQECHQLGIQTVAVTNGYISSPAREDFYAVMDAANVDLKAFSPTFYRKLCLASLQPVLDTLVYIAQKTRVWLELTTLLIPGQNDATPELEAMCKWLVQQLGSAVPLHFSAFHAAYKMTGVARTPDTTLARARQIALQAGIQHVYTGNTYDPEGQSTFCASCGHLLIGRQGYRVGHNDITRRGTCPACDALVPGRYL